MLKKILVTGGAGFIGSNLVDYLLDNGYKIMIIDNFNDYYDIKIKGKNIAELINHKNNLNLDNNHLIIKKGDIRDKEFIYNIFKHNEIDMVIHLAAMAGVRPSIKMPTYYYDVNINGTVNILEACKDNGVKKFIFASSSSVYGNNKKVPFSETDFVDNPISPYAATKKSGELLCYTYHYLYNLSVACLRFFTVYGPRQRPDLAIHKFTNLILQDSEIPFYGDGSTERDYTFVDDIIVGIAKVMEWLDIEEKQYDIFNLGESRTISLIKLVETLENVIGKKAKLKKLPLQPGDVRKTFADISKAKQILGYDPKTNFEDGIKKFVSWKLSDAL